MKEDWNIRKGNIFPSSESRWRGVTQEVGTWGNYDRIGVESLNQLCFQRIWHQCCLVRKNSQNQSHWVYHIIIFVWLPSERCLSDLLAVKWRLVVSLLCMRICLT